MQQLVQFAGHSQGFQILKPSLRLDQAFIEWNKQVFGYKNACVHLTQDQIPRCVLWVTNGDAKIIWPDKSEWFTLVGDEWRAELDLTKDAYRECDQVSLIALYQPGREPGIKPLASIDSLTGPLSELINGSPLTSVTSATQYAQSGVKAGMWIVARWLRKGVERKVKDDP